MAKYSLTKKGNVIQCKKDCNANHKHFVGSYENAIRYFGIDEEAIENYGDIFNVIFWKQTNGLYPPKLSNELYDICIQLQSEHKHWAVEKERHKNAINALKKAEKLGLIKDNMIIKSLKLRGRKNDLERIYWYEKWKENIE